MEVLERDDIVMTLSASRRETVWGKLLKWIGDNANVMYW